MKFVFRITFFISGITFAHGQDSWQAAADKFLESQVLSEWSYEGYESLQVLRQRLAEAFNNGELDIRLVQMLAVWEVEAGNSGSPYLERVMQHYASAPLMKALFLLDLMSVSHGERHVPVETHEVLTLLRDVNMDSSGLYVHALLETASRHAYKNKFRETKKHLDDAHALILRIGGEDEKLYNNVLSALSGYYARIGNIEQSVVYQQKAERNSRQYHGVRQPYHSLFDKKRTDINLPDESGHEVQDLCRIADLLRYTTRFGEGGEPSPYRLYAASFVFEEIAAHPDRGRNLEFDVWVDTQRAQLAMARSDYESASTLLERVVEEMQRFRPLAHILFRETDARNLLACVYIKQRRFSEAETLFSELYSLADRRYARIPDVTAKIFHNRVLTLLEAGEDQRLRQALDHIVNPTDTKPVHEDRMTLYARALYHAGDYQGAFALYQRLYDHYWSEASAAYHQQENFQDDLNEAALIDEVNIRLEIGDSTVIQTVYPYKPYHDAYKNILGELALAAFQARKYELAATYALEYINEFYDALDKSHFHLERGTDLHEIYRLEQALFPYYDLFLNVLLADSLSVPNVSDKRRRMSFAHVLDAKASIRYEHRQMRAAIENSPDEMLKAKFREYLQYRETLAALKIAGGDPGQIERLTVSIDTLTAWFSAKTACFEDISKRFVFWHQLKEQLGKDEAAVEIKRFTTINDSSVVYAAYVVTPATSSPEIVFLTNGEFLEDRGLKKYQNAMQAGVEDLTSYGDYWKPIAGKLGPQVRKIYFSPDGVYNHINIHTLFNAETGRYVVDDVTVYSMISTKDLLRRGTDEMEVRSVILMGRPAYRIADKRYRGEFDPFEETP